MALFVPVSATFDSYIGDRDQFAYIKLLIDTNNDGSFDEPDEDFTEYLDNNQVTIDAREDYTQVTVVIRNSGGTFTTGDYAGLNARIEAAIGEEGYYRVFTGWVDRTGIQVTGGEPTTRGATLTLVSLAKRKAVTKKPDPTILSAYEISSSDPASILHYLADLIGIDSEDVDASTISAEKTVAFIGSRSVWKELQSIRDQYCGWLYDRYDGKLRFFSPLADDYADPGVEWTFSAALGNILGPPKTAQLSMQGNRVSTVFSDYTQLTQRVIWKSLENFNEETGKISIEVAAGAYYPGEAASDVAQLRYVDPGTGEEYNYADNVQTPSIGSTNADIECSGGILTLVSFNGSAGSNPGITNAQPDYTEIILYNGTASTITITKFELRGRPYHLNADVTIQSVESGVEDEDIVDAEIDGTWATSRDQAADATDYRLEEWLGPRRQATFPTHWLPQVQRGAKCRFIDPRTSEDWNGYVVSYRHTTKSAYPAWRTEVTLTEAISTAGSGTEAAYVRDRGALGPDIGLYNRWAQMDAIDASHDGLFGGDATDASVYHDVYGGTAVAEVPTRIFRSTLGAYDDPELAAKRYAAENFVDAITYAADLAEIESQIDRSITTWYYSGAPTLSNAPAVDWTTTTLKDEHIGDLYYDSATGDAYRFLYNGDTSTYSWASVVDPDVEAALEAAEDAQDTADSKRRIFYAEPVPPYDVGDMWATGSELKRCTTAKASGGSYASGDWTDQTTYQTYVDTQAALAQTNAEEYARDWTEGVFSGLDGGSASSDSIRLDVYGGTAVAEDPDRLFIDSRGATVGAENIDAAVTAEASERETAVTAAKDSIAAKLGFSDFSQLETKLSGAPLFFLNTDSDKGPVGAALINFDLVDTVAMIAELVDAGQLFANDIVVEQQIRAGYDADGDPPASGAGFWLGSSGILKMKGGTVINDALSFGPDVGSIDIETDVDIDVTTTSRTAAAQSFITEMGVAEITEDTIFYPGVTGSVLMKATTGGTPETQIDLDADDWDSFKWVEWTDDSGCTVDKLTLTFYKNDVQVATGWFYTNTHSCFFPSVLTRYNLAAAFTMKYQKILPGYLPSAGNAVSGYVYKDSSGYLRVKE